MIGILGIPLFCAMMMEAAPSEGSGTTTNNSDIQITLSPTDYATAFRLLATTARHHINIEQEFVKSVLPHLKKTRKNPSLSLLDVGAGPGTVAKQLAPYFDSITLLEPNQAQLVGFELSGQTKIIHKTLEAFLKDDDDDNTNTEKYDVVVCSHVLYHMPVSQWPTIVNQLLSLVKPKNEEEGEGGGYVIIVLGAASGQNYDLHCDFIKPDEVITSTPLIHDLKTNRNDLKYSVASTENSFYTSSYEEMYVLVRFFVLEDCFQDKQKFNSLTKEDLQKLEEKIKKHTLNCYRKDDNLYHLTQGDDIIFIQK